MTKPLFIVDPRVDWAALSKNKAAIHILEKNLDKVDWWGLLSGNEAAIHILEKNLDKVNWWILSMNRAAIYILEHNLDKVDWCNLSYNEAAIPILEKNLDKVNWHALSRNKAAIHLLAKFNTLPNLIKSIQEDPTCMDNIYTTDVNGKNRKISKTAIATIIKFLS